MPNKEPVDLLDLSLDVAGRLQFAADNKEVTLSVQGEQLIITGYKKILEEMIYNLCDNAIKYNVPNGSTAIKVTRNNNLPAITIEDTGIGIPDNHQSHIFERFYRVDRSRSKETGGTGLGLSIVKHGAILHDAKINLRSVVGTGTKVEIVFPK